MLLLANPAVMLVGPLVFTEAVYDAERDFRPLSHVNDYEFAVAVGSAVPVRELRHLMAWCAPTPGRPASAFRPRAACRISLR